MPDINIAFLPHLNIPLLRRKILINIFERRNETKILFHGYNANDK